MAPPGSQAQRRTGVFTAGLVGSLWVAVVASCTGGSTNSSGGGGGSTGGGPGTFIFPADSGGVPNSGDGCGGRVLPVDASTGCDNLEGGVTFRGDVAPIFRRSCNGEMCHATPTYASIVNVPSTECCDQRPLVAPFNARGSYLLDKVTGAPLCGGGPMPLGGGSLSNDEILVLRRWICEGAPDN